MGGPYRGMLLELGESVPKLADRWKSAVWLGKSDLTDEHLIRTDEGVVFARSVRRLAEHSWSEETSEQFFDNNTERPKTTIADIPLAADPLALPHAHARMRRKNLRRNMRKTKK